MTIEQYITEKAEEFLDNHFQTFYLDVIHRGYTLDRYLDEGKLFEEHVESLADYDFPELRKMLNISKTEAIGMRDDDMANRFKDELRLQIENRFMEGMERKLSDIVENLEEDELTDREIKTLQNHRENLLRAINEGYS